MTVELSEEQGEAVRDIALHLEVDLGMAAGRTRAAATRQLIALGLHVYKADERTLARVREWARANGLELSAAFTRLWSVALDPSGPMGARRAEGQ